MPATLLAPPAAEPISLADVKAHLRLDGDAEDAQLARVIAAARAHVETLTRRVLVTQGWRVYLDHWPASRRVVLPVAPVRSLLAVTVHGADGTPKALPIADFSLDKARIPAVLEPAPGTPAPGRRLSGIEIDVEAGHGVPTEVPEPLREAVLRLAALWHEHRLAAGEMALGPTPPAVDALIAPYRVPTL